MPAAESGAGVFGRPVPTTVLSLAKQWAFDRHLFWVDDDYRVRVAEDFGELGGHDYGVQRFNGQRLRLPKVREWWPLVENLAAQRKAESA